MERIEHIPEMTAISKRMKSEGKTIGFVPTMGFLHEGHLALVEAAKKENDVVIMSIFVNPAQFGPGEDFESYPRDLERDAQLAEQAGVDILFHPAPDGMYPSDSGIRILPGSQASVLCGESRPGHFDGVLKVITKLFHLTLPDKAYFGLKDAQQLAIIETFVTEYNFPVEIRRVQTVRETDGLAKSSRNVRLAPEERSGAPAIHRALKEGVNIFMETGGLDGTIASVRGNLRLIPGAEIDYVEMLDYPSLQPVSKYSREAILAAAVQFGNARLIDNVLIPIEER